MTRMLLVTAMIAALCTGPGEGRRWYIDLTHPIHEHVVSYPGMPKYNFTNLHKSADNGFWVEYNKFQLSEHAGTHMDAPIHFNRYGQYLHEVPLDNLVGPGVVVDITHKASRNRNAQVEITDLIRWEQAHGEIPRGAFVIMKSGWFLKYPDTMKIFGVDVDKASPKEFRFPGFAPAAAEWLVNHRDINGIGGDTPSPDRGGSTDMMTHRIILGANKVILENVASLDRIPASGTTIYALPINLHKGSGGPMRMFATLPERQIYDYTANAGQRPLKAFWVLVSCLVILLDCLQL